MAMAEVAATPSHTSAAGATVPAVAASSSRSKSPLLFASPSSTPRANVHTHQHPHSQLNNDQRQQTLQSQYNPTSSPGDGSSSSFFSHHQRLSPTGSMLLSTSERNIPRGLPPIVSPMTGATQSGPSVNDPRQPISPRTVTMGLSDSAQGLDGVSGVSGDTAPRKRSKVSRACDECRRKKIRCDATSESGVEQCSSCKRVGSKCSFSRVPMKRGPSKGYIKELADRLNTLENSISTGDLHPYGSGMTGEGDHSPGPSDSTSPPPNGPPSASKSRKRALSSSSDFQTSMHLQPLSQPTGRSNERLPSIDSFHPTTQHQHQQRAQHLQHEPQPQRQLPHPQQPPPPPPLPPPLTHPHQPQPHQSPLQPPSSTTEASSGYRTISPTNMNQYWKGASDVAGRRQSISFPFDAPDMQRSATSSTPVDLCGFDWDDQAIDQYYELIHPTFPLLPHSKDRLHQRLASSSPSVREAFLEALYSTVRISSSSALRANSPVSNAKRVCELTVASQFENPAVRTMPTNLLYLQTMILMGLEADNHGPATIHGQFGPPKAAWLGAAVGLAYNLKLHNSHTQSQSREQSSNGDPDSDEKLGRRAWVVLFVLDRWHAISTSSPLFIPDSSFAFVPDDQKLLGLAPYYIARLSYILGHLAEAFTITVDSASAAPFKPIISKILRGELELFRESVGDIWGSLKPLHVVYYHVKLLTLRLNSAEPHQLMGPAQNLTAMLANPQIPATPLNHHFVALSLMTLVELSEIPETREEAWKGIMQLADALEERKNVNTKEDNLGWGSALRDLVNKRKQERFGSSNPGMSDIPLGHGSLQHLAELAVGERSPTGTPTNPLNKQLDTERLQKHGYLGSILL